MTISSVLIRVHQWLNNYDNASNPKKSIPKIIFLPALRALRGISLCFSPSTQFVGKNKLNIGGYSPLYLVKFIGSW
ncbi:MAG: hypothetical protein AB1422_12730 [bacterium]